MKVESSAFIANISMMKKKKKVTFLFLCFTQFALREGKEETHHDGL